MAEDRDISVGSIKEDRLTDKPENVQTNMEIKKAASEDDIVPKEPLNTSSSTTLEKEDDLYIQEQTHSIAFIDLENSKKYSITLEQARNRALRAIKRARERSSSLMDEED